MDHHHFGNTSPQQIDISNSNTSSLSPLVMAINSNDCHSPSSPQVQGSPASNHSGSSTSQSYGSAGNGASQGSSSNHGTPKPRMVVDWTEVETEILMNEYEVHRCLWDPSHPSYHSNSDRIHAYVNILEKLGPKFNITDIKKKINSIRTQYNQERNRLIKMTEAGIVRSEESRFKYYDRLSFLAESVDTRRNQRSTTPKSADEAQPSSGTRSISPEPPGGLNNSNSSSELLKSHQNAAIALAALGDTRSSSISPSLYPTTLPMSHIHTSPPNSRGGLELNNPRSRSDSPHLPSSYANCHQLPLPKPNNGSPPCPTSSVVAAAAKAAAAAAVAMNCENKSPLSAPPSAVAPLSISTINDLTSSLNLANHKSSSLSASPCLANTASRMLSNCSNKEMRLDVSMGLHNSSSGTVIPISPVAAFGNTSTNTNGNNNSNNTNAPSSTTSGPSSGFSLPISGNSFSSWVKQEVSSSDLSPTKVAKPTCAILPEANKNRSVVAPQINQSVHSTALANQNSLRSMVPPRKRQKFANLHNMANQNNSSTLHIPKNSTVNLQVNEARGDKVEEGRQTGADESFGAYIAAEMRSIRNQSVKNKLKLQIVSLIIQSSNEEILGLNTFE